MSVPVALGGKLNGIPFITHDSDAIPSLANRLIARWATLHAVALPEDTYPYPRVKTKTFGIPLSHEYKLVTIAAQAKFRKVLNLDAYKQILLVTGGGNGAERLNTAVIDNARYLLERHPGLCIVHVAGRGLEAATNTAYDQELSSEARKHVLVKGFITNFYQYSGAADVIIARAGATNLAEFAVQGRACVIVPAQQLVGGHQIENAKIFAKKGAIVLLTQDQIEQERRLATVVGELLTDNTKRAELGSNLTKFARDDAAQELAMVLLDIAKHNKKT